jgi:two-component system, OmpR family, phosphate regulon sensor histidine kinase PhoR
LTFRHRLFLTSLITAAVTLLAATTLVSWSVRGNLERQIERSLVNEARLAAETLSHRQAATPGELDAEADAIGRLVSARVTFIGADGTVVGDSQVAAGDLAALENHATRPEIQQARAEGLGVARRYSTTVQTDMLYVAVPVRGPGPAGLSQIRLALPLTDVRDQLAAVRRSAVVALGAGMFTALALAWGTSALLSRRAITAPTKSAPSRASWTNRSARSPAGRPSATPTARAWKRSSAA